MKKDIDFRPVEGVAVIVARTLAPEGHYEWNVHLLNKNPFLIHNVLVTSKGYGMLNDEPKKTSVLRHHFDEIPAGGTALVEPIDPAVFPLVNEYWVSYYIGMQIYDKKFIFMPDTIIEANLMQIPNTKMEGILHE
jgi:hypothetical protein